MITSAYVRTMAAYQCRDEPAALRRGRAARRCRAAGGEKARSGARSTAPSSTSCGATASGLSRFDGWPRPATPIKESDHFIEDFTELCAARDKADADISRWAGKVDDDWLDEDMVCSAAPPGARSAPPKRLLVNPFLQPSDPSPRPGACAVDRRRPGDRRHRSVPDYPADHRLNNSPRGRGSRIKINRHPGEGRDLSFNSSTVCRWVPAFAGKTVLFGAPVSLQ